jgi:hypothetical protein
MFPNIREREGGGGREGGKRGKEREREREREIANKQRPPTVIWSIDAGHDFVKGRTWLTPVNY